MAEAARRPVKKKKPAKSISRKKTVKKLRPPQKAKHARAAKTFATEVVPPAPPITAPPAPTAVPPKISGRILPGAFIKYAASECTGSNALEPSQLEAVVNIDAFLASSERYLVIQGYAGTGKTFLLAVLNNFLKSRKRQRQLMAPTGRAARILAKFCGSPATTIHSAVYELHSLTTRPTGTLFTFNYPRKKIKPIHADLITIVDEGSMVSDKAPKRTKFFAFGYGFGTGRLLKDLMGYLMLDDPAYQTKLIIVGDPCQLPPVQEEDSHALSPSYMASVHGISVNPVELSNIVRHAKGSGIVKAATKLRRMITDNIGNYLTIEDRVTVCGVSGRADLIRMGVATATGGLSKFVIITYSNPDALEINLGIRAGLGRTEICVGDRLVITANNQNHDLHNGSFVNVVAVASLIETFPSPKLPSKEMLTFRDIDVEFEDVHGIIQRRTIKLFVNGLHDGIVADINDTLRNALFEFFKLRLTAARTAKKATGIGLLSDPYFNAVRAKYGYAVTCHKAQGGEWEEVGIDFGNRKDINSPTMRKWAYTAMTRARNIVYLENAPEIHPLTKIMMNAVTGGSVPVGVRMKARLVGRFGMAAPGAPALFCEYDEFLCRLLTHAIAPLGILIEDVDKSLQDSLRLKFKRGISYTHIDFYRRMGTTKSGKPKPVMFGSALAPGLSGSDPIMANQIMEKLAELLIS
jgi:hypothetical protein